MKMQTISYHDGLINSLRDPQEAALYIKAALEETLQDGNWEAFLIALNNICEARETAGMGGMPKELDNLKPEALHLGTIYKILEQVGISIEFKPVDMPVTAA